MSSHSSPIPAPIASLALAFMFCASLLPLALHAAEPAHGRSHGQPGDIAAVITSSRTTTDSSTTEQQKQLMQQMQRMRAIHDKMQAATTPAARRALMDENMKLMQEGMTLMQGMQHSSGMDMMESGGMDLQKCMEMHKAMSQRMDMMEMLMQMMLDQQSAASPQ